MPMPACHGPGHGRCAGPKDCSADPSRWRPVGPSTEDGREGPRGTLSEPPRGCEGQQAGKLQHGVPGEETGQGGRGPPTSWWMLSMARLYLSQSLCMLSKLKNQGEGVKVPVSPNRPRALQASRGGQHTDRQSPGPTRGEGRGHRAPKRVHRGHKAGPGAPG